MLVWSELVVVIAVNIFLGGLEFGTSVQCILVVLSTIVMASTSKSALFNIEKLDGTTISLLEGANLRCFGVEEASKSYQMKRD